MVSAFLFVYFNDCYMFVYIKWNDQWLLETWGGEKHLISEITSEPEHTINWWQR